MLIVLCVTVVPADFRLSCISFQVTAFCSLVPSLLLLPEHIVKSCMAHMSRDDWL